MYLRYRYGGAKIAKGYPDIPLLEPIAKVFGVSITELISGNAISNVNVSANMMRSNFYVCPVCGNSKLGFAEK